MGSFPRTYHVTRGWKMFLIGLSLLMGVPSLLGAWYFATTHEAKSAGAGYAMAGVCLVFVGLSAYLILSTLRSKIVLYADRIELHELTSVRSLRRDEIAGWRFQANTSPALLVFNCKDASAKPAKTAFVFRMDDVLADWLDELDNLDANELEDSYEEIDSNAELGSDDEERLAALERARRLARWLNGAGVGLGLWALFNPRPYELVIGSLLLCPWIAIFAVWRSAGLIRFDSHRNDAHPDVGILFLIPSVILMFRAVRDFEPAGWTGVLAPALLITSAVFAAMLASHADLRAKKAMAAAMSLFPLLYGFGAAIAINGMADTTHMTQHRYMVVEKYIATAKGKRYVAKLRADRPESPDVDNAEVYPDFYEKLQPGDSVCLNFRPGALGIVWSPDRPRWLRCCSLPGHGSPDPCSPC